MAGTVVHSETYEGVKILYDESDNVWRFTLRGRERSSESLAKAKESIDKPVPEEKKKGFIPVQAWKGDSYYGTKWKQVIVTSIAEKGYRSYDELWIKDGTCRSKECSSSIFAFTDENAALIDKMNSLTEQIEKLEEQRKGLSRKMEKFTVPSVD